MGPASRCGPPSLGHHQDGRIKQLSAELCRDAESHGHEASTICVHRSLSRAASHQSAEMASSRSGLWSLRNSCTTCSIGFSNRHRRTLRFRCLRRCLGSPLSPIMACRIPSSTLRGYDGTRPCEPSGVHPNELRVQRRLETRLLGHRPRKIARDLQTAATREASSRRGPRQTPETAQSNPPTFVDICSGLVPRVLYVRRAVA